MDLPIPSASLGQEDIVRLYLDVQTDAVVKGIKTVEDLDKAVDKATKSTMNMGRATLETGRILQDFSQGGIGGILNNIEGFATALGGGPGLAGLMTGVGLAAFFAIPYIKAWWKEISDGANDIPKSKDKVIGLNDELKTTKDRLDELRKESKLTNTELREFNQLLDDQIRLEKDLETAREEARRKKQQADARAKAENAPEAEAAKERAEILQAGLGGQQHDLELEILRHLKTQGPAQIQQVQAEALRTPAGPERIALLRILARLRGVMGSKDRTGAIENLENEAIGGGDISAIRALTRLLPKGSQFRGLFGVATPEGIEAANQSVEDAEAFGQRAHEGSRKFREDYARRLKADKIGNMLNEQGRDIERQTWQQKEREDEHDKLKAKHDQEKRDRENLPENRLAARIRERQNHAIEEAQRQNKRGGYGASDEQILSVAREAARFPGNLSQNVDSAFGMAYAKLLEQRQHMSSVNQALRGWATQLQGIPQPGETYYPNGQ
jgi:hypothetical protein